MAKNHLPSLFYLVLITLFFALNCHCQEGPVDDGKNVYIVYMGELPKDGVVTSSLHHNMIADVLGSTDRVKESLVYSYGRSFNGFAAKMSSEEADTFSGMKGVVSVFPSTILKLHTTRSWDFIGFTEKDPPRYPYESDVIVGLIDSGIWPESESFNDDGFGPPPTTWKGICQTTNITCNKKVIGARFYNSVNFYQETDIKSPRDTEGHGTHTASTVTGRVTANASYFGLGEGVARGAVPQARVAMYKACWSWGCFGSDILAAFDDAIADGVNIISVSLGGGSQNPYLYDPIAIGSFHAMKNGILTSNSAGNFGPWLKTLSNYAPWSLTVAASSIDRKFVSQVVLGNGQSFVGNSINNFALNGSVFPLVYAGDSANFSYGYDGGFARYCLLPGYLNSEKVEGKIVICDAIWDGSAVIAAKAVGTIMNLPLYSIVFNDFSQSYPIPATVVTTEDAQKMLDYVRTASDPVATIVGETWEDIRAPVVVSFSSRGPNPITPGILKPDLTAPGVEILAAWSPIAPPSGFSTTDSRAVNFNIISGTSMSCPHVSGAAAYIKSAHPIWSPAAIKSALMTTASILGTTRNEEAEFAYGSGQINPLKAADPGLVYDASVEDYIDFLCNEGYNTTTLRYITGDSSTCPSNSNKTVWDLNYPSMSLAIQDGQPIMGSFPRTVTNVGSPNSTYSVTIDAPPSIKIVVEPNVLSFASIGENKSFTVTVSGGVIVQQPIISCSIVWSDGVHAVRSPLVVYTVLPSSMPGTFKRSPLFEGPSVHPKNRLIGGS